ncbi:MAG: hypothetical protein WCC21_12625 [Candidatus Acidiferrales bacterium]
MRDLHGLHFLGVDAAPHGMAVFARHAVLVLFLVKNDGAGLPDEVQASFGAVEQLKILFAGKAALALIGAG